MLAIATMGESSSAPEPAEGAVLKHREPTPDHPPYSWMIGEAIAALGEAGGSAEAAISDFIRARHPGVPAAHDRFLRHYLAKHVAEGLFVCSATGRYSRPLDDDELVLELEDAPALATEPKRGRGRPRKNGSAPTPAAGKGRSETPSATPKRRGRPRKDGSPSAAASAGSPATEGKRRPGRPRKDGSSPSPAASKKGGSRSPTATPKRCRGRPRVLPRTEAADVSGEACVTDMKDGGDAPSTTDNNHGEPRELALVVAIDGSTAPSVTEDDGDGAPSAKLPLLTKEPAAITTPEHSTEPCELALVAADEGSAPALAADKEDGTIAPFEGSGPVLVADKGDGIQAPFEEVSAPALVSDKEDGTQAPFEEGPVPALVADKEDRTQAPSVGSAPLLAADKEVVSQTPLKGSAPALAANKDDGTQTPFQGSAPALVANKDDFTEPLFTKHKRRRRTCRSAPVKASHAPSWTSIAENKAGGKAASAPPKSRGRQCEPASAAAGELQPRQLVPIKPRKMLFLNAGIDKVPDHPMFCVLALPAPVPAATKA